MTEKMQMQTDMVSRLAVLLQEQHPNMSMENALDAVFNSTTYQKVMDPQTTLYYQSPRYVYSFLNDEMRRGKC